MPTTNGAELTSEFATETHMKSGVGSHMAPIRNRRKASS